MSVRDFNDKYAAGEVSDIEDGTEPVNPPPGHPDDESADAQLADPFEGLWISARDLRCFDVSARPEPRRWLLMRDPDGEHETNRLDLDADARGVGFLPLGKVGMLVAAGGIGKTMALCQLAIAVATGRRWLGRYEDGRCKGGGFIVPPRSTGRVLLALAEEDQAEAHRRLYDAAQAMGLSPAEREAAADRIDVLPLAGVPVALTESDGQGNTKPTKAIDALHGRLQRRSTETLAEWRLVVLDPLSRFAGNDTEKDNAAATRFVQAVETLVRAPGGPTVLLAHHTSKAAKGANAAQLGADGANAARGASGLTDGVRWVANLDPWLRGSPSRPLALSLAKSNYSPPAGDVVLLRGPDGALSAASAADIERLKKEHEEKQNGQARGRDRETNNDASKDDGRAEGRTEGTGSGVRNGYGRRST